MIRNTTVLILGAGASDPYGFPLGGKLVDMILHFISSETGAMRQTLARLEFRGGDIEDFRRDLDGSGLRSIDLFLEDLEPGDVNVQIGKAAIAHTTLWFEDRDKLFGENRAEAHWYEYVWNLMRAGSNPDNLHENGLSIVTFNYECSFEYYFTTAMKHSFDIPKWEDAWSLFHACVPVVHLHGEVGGAELFGAPAKPLAAELVRSAAERIRIVHDPMAKDDARFVRARNLISKATCVAFVGFGYHETNLARINLRDCVPNGVRTRGQLFGSAYKMAKAEIARANVAAALRIQFADPQLDALQFVREHLVFE